MKSITLTLAFIICLSLLPVVSLAEEVCIVDGSFESDVLLWNQSIFSTDYPYSGNKCLSVSPSPAQAGSYPIFKTDYSKSVLLTRNKVYEISFYVRTDSLVNSFTPNCKINLSTENKHLDFVIQNPSLTWQKITSSFIVDRTEYYNLTLKTELPTENTTFFIDEISLYEVDFKPTSLSASGSRMISIPAFGIATYEYKPIVIDKEYGSYPIHNAQITFNEELPPGVRFDTEMGILSVSSDAPADSVMGFTCSIPGSITAAPVTQFVKLTKSVLPNGSFDDFPFGAGWNDSEMQVSIQKDSGADNFYGYLQPSLVSENVYMHSISSERSLVLYASEIYVFRAKVRSDIPYTARNMGAQVLGPNANNLLRFQIANISGNQWNEVSTAFQVPTDGVYTVALDLHTPYNSPIHIDDIVIQQEEALPLSVYFDSPLHISTPNDGALSIPLQAAVLNPFGLPQAKPVSFSVEPENSFVKIENGKLSVSPYSPAGEYVIVAYLNDDVKVQCRRTLIVSNESVYDGSFEKSEPGQAWMTAQPSQLHYVSTFKDIYPSDGKNLARLTMNGSVSMIMSDSTYGFSSGKNYIFETDMAMVAPDIETVVTVLVDNSESDSFDDNLVVGQFKLSKQEAHICQIFTPTQSITGRLMIAFNTPEEHDQQIILMDSISVSKAQVYASSVSVSGSPFVDKNIVGIYRFSSNFNAVDASTYRWLISDSPGGIFMPIPGENDNVLAVTQEMLNKYVKFEVTPTSLTGPVIGESVLSGIVLIGEPISYTPPAEPEQQPPPSAKPSVPDDHLNPTVPKAELHALDITKFMPPDKAIYYDLDNHWASTDIALLTAANVLQGRGNGLFEPEAPITRAEFAAILARAFQLAPIFYENLYTDVKGSNWYAGVVAVVTKHGITKGTSSLTFSPNLPITREEMAVMIMRAFKKTGLHFQSSETFYADKTDISTWALTDISIAGSLQIMNGTPSGNFLPKNNATRAEAAAVIRRMLTIIAKNR